MDNRAIRHIVIVGGGTAGWITAGLIAARHPDRSEAGLKITLIESPDVPTIGVGEGTWPTIRRTLSRIGLSEADFLTACDASFKQGSRFEKWVTGEESDVYFHPFELPVSQSGNDVLTAWQSMAPEKSFAEAVCAQVGPELIGLAPKKRGAPDYAGSLNYAYHLDATKLGMLLRDHVQKHCDVTYVQDHVVDVIGDKSADIEAVMCRQSGRIEGDLFIDCTGQKSMLLGGHYGIGLVDQSHILFNDRALVTQVAVSPDSMIASETVSTAHEAGWIWDIGLPTRRGVGCVYASGFMDDEAAEKTLRTYVGEDADITTRLLKFQSGYRETFWHRNCVAVGLSAGFLEPLEASAIVMVELSAERIAENLPVSQVEMRVEAKRFNEVFHYRWGRIIDFLKLHYVMSQRTEPYWQENRRAETIPDRLRDYLEVWKSRPPGPKDFEHADEIFPAASYLFVAYGMGMAPTPHRSLAARTQAELQKGIQTNARKRKVLSESLPTNRAFLNALARFKLQHTG